MHSNRQLSNLARILCRINKQFFGCVVVVDVLFTRFGIKFVSMVKPRGKVRVRQPFWERVTVETILSTRITSIVRNVMLLSESFLHFSILNLSTILHSKKSLISSFPQIPSQFFVVAVVQRVSLLYVTCDTIYAITFRRSHIVTYRESSSSEQNIDIKWSIYTLYFGTFVFP